MLPTPYNEIICGLTGLHVPVEAPMKIVVLDGYTLNPGDNPWDEIDRLGDLTVYDRIEQAEVIERASNADIVLTNKTPLTRATFAALPRLGLVSVLATGYDVVECGAARERGVIVCNVPAYATASVAQHVFALIFGLTHQVDRHDYLVRQGAWEQSGQFSFWETAPTELAGKTLGIVGLGRVGRRVAAIACAFGMEVLAATSRVPSPLPEFELTGVDEMFSRADVVSLHCPLTDATRRMVDGRLLTLMKPSAILINTARGDLIDDDALAFALSRGQLAGAALDVVSTEPIRRDSPLLSAPNCIITPHLAWASLAARRRLMHQTAENIRAFLAGRPINVVT